MNEDMLVHVDLFSTLNKKELQTLAKSCQERSYSAGTVLFSQGDTGVGLYVLKNGKVRITIATNPDRAEVEVGIYGPNDVLGEMRWSGKNLADAVASEANKRNVPDVHYARVGGVLAYWSY